jgi:glyoxylase-like metal-dependent hydrolase (beta-lactamase superfamily II)
MALRLSLSRLAVVALFWLVGASHAQGDIPAWCKALPRPEYRNLERVPLKDTWFEVYRIVPGVFAIYEPHQSEETIAYLILGSKRALMFDTGMGIGNLKVLISQLTQLPIMVLNSHTHDDHVGDNWQFDSVYGIDTGFSRKNARGSREDAQAEIALGELCGDLPRGFDRGGYATRPWKIAGWLHDGERIDLGDRTIEVITTPGHTPDAISLFDPLNGLLFTGDTYYPGTIWLYRPETDLAAYRNSVQRLSALVPHVKMVLGANNVSVARPEVLNQLAAAFESVRTNAVTASPAGEGKVVYKVGEISFLMRKK